MHPNKLFIGSWKSSTRSTSLMKVLAKDTAPSEWHFPKLVQRAPGRGRAPSRRQPDLLQMQARTEGARKEGGEKGR